MKSMNIAIIGCGNLGMALARGLIDSGVQASGIRLTRRHTDVLSSFAEEGCMVMSDNRKAIEGCSLVILAVKPYNVEALLQEISPGIIAGQHIVASVATGISTATLVSLLPKGTSVFRAMPNTAADVKESLTCVCASGSGRDGSEVVESLFAVLGEVIWIEEALMEAATVLGACGIAYVMRFIRAMVQGGIEIGFDAHTASAIVQQTVRGAAQLLIERSSHPESEIDKVTTPKGCTIAGLNEMEHHGFSSALIKGIKASYDQINGK